MPPGVIRHLRIHSPRVVNRKALRPKSTVPLPGLSRFGSITATIEQHTSSVGNVCHCAIGPGRWLIAGNTSKPRGTVPFPGVIGKPGRAKVKATEQHRSMALRVIGKSVIRTPGRSHCWKTLDPRGAIPYPRVVERRGISTPSTEEDEVPARLIANHRGVCARWRPEGRCEQPPGRSVPFPGVVVG